MKGVILVLGLVVLVTLSFAKDRDVKIVTPSSRRDYKCSSTNYRHFAFEFACHNNLDLIAHDHNKSFVKPDHKCDFVCYFSLLFRIFLGVTMFVTATALNIPIWFE